MTIEKIRLKGESHVSRKLGRYVTVDDGGNYVTMSRFYELNLRIKIFFKYNSSQRELYLSNKGSRIRELIPQKGLLLS